MNQYEDRPDRTPMRRCAGMAALLMLATGSAYAQPIGLNNEADRLALVALYDETGGDFWVDNAGWKSDLPLGDWYGVKLDDSGRVVELRLRANGLSGTLPDPIGLERLQLLDLSFNWGLEGEFRTVPQALEEVNLAVTHVCLPTPLPQVESDVRLCGRNEPVTIDVVVLYTESARVFVGGRGAIETQIKALFKDVHEIYAASDFRHTIDVAATHEVEDVYQTRDPVADAHRLASSPEVADLRGGADLVHLLVAVEPDPAPNAAVYRGIAQHLGPHGLTNIRDVDPAAIIAHELGHNLGLRHDRYTVRYSPNSSPEMRRQANSPDPAFGYADVRSRWYTLMSYWTECDDANVTCRWLTQFSDPRKLGPNGFPLGMAFGDPMAADAVSVLDSTAPIVAMWR